jgi:hypothetical protein
MNHQTKIVNSLIDYSDDQLKDLVSKVRIQREKARRKEKQDKARMSLAEVPKKTLANFIRRTKKLFKGKKFTYPALSLTLKVTETLLWEQDNYVQPRNTKVKIQKKGTSFEVGSWMEESLAGIFEDLDFDARNEACEKLNVEIKQLIDEINACEAELGLDSDTIWDHVYDMCM